MWIFDNVDEDSYWKIHDYLNEFYNVEARLQDAQDNFIEFYMDPPGTDALIIHTMDQSGNERFPHNVSYYDLSGVE